MTYAPVIPFTNATLTAIKGGGFSENYDQNESGDTTRWSGSEPVYVGEERLTEQGRRLEHTSRAYVAIPQSLGIAVKQGDAVFFTHKSQPKERAVDDIRDLDLAGVTRLYFTDQ